MGFLHTTLGVDLLGCVVTPCLKEQFWQRSHGREAARKGEVIKKEKPKKGGVSRIKLLRTPALWWHTGRRVLERKLVTDPWS